MIVANRAVLAVADELELFARQSQRCQILLGLLGASIAQRKVVFLRSTLVAVTFHGQFEIGILLDDVRERLRVLLQSDFGIGTKRVLVVIEISILDAV